MLRGTDYKCCADAACVALVKVPVIFSRMGQRYGYFIVCCIPDLVELKLGRRERSGANQYLALMT